MNPKQLHFDSDGREKLLEGWIEAIEGFKERNN